MSYNNTEAAVPTRIATAAFLNTFLGNLDYHRGLQAGQTSIDLQAEVSVPALRSEGTRFEMRRQFDATPDGGGNVAEFVLRSDNADSPSSIEDGAGPTVVLQAGESGGATQDMAELIAIRENERTGSLSLAALGAFAGDDLFLAPLTGFVGVELPSSSPEVPLDIGSGTMDVASGDYRQDGAVLNDWAETLGPPDKLSWAGRAQTTQQFRSTVATGTAPISLSGSSTTMCPNLDPEFLDGYGWHDGITSGIVAASFNTSDTDIATITLDRVGKWAIRAGVIAVDESATSGVRNIDLKLKDGGGSAIGRTVRVTSVGYSNVCAKLHGPYTSAAGNETIKVTAAMNTGTDGFALAYLVATWEGP